MLLMLVLCAPLAMAETIRYCDYPVYPPVSWSDGHTVRGLAPKVAEAVSEELGIPLKIIVLGNWKRCLMDAIDGRVDIILAYRTAQREQGLAFTETPVLREEVTLFYNRRQPLHPERLEDLSNYRGGLLFGESYGTTFDRFIVNNSNNIEYVSSNWQNFGKLIRQRINYIVHERRTGLLLLERQPGGHDIVAAEQPITVDYLRLAISRSSPLLPHLQQIDALLARLQQNGSLARWLEESEHDYRATLDTANSP